MHPSPATNPYAHVSAKLLEAARLDGAVVLQRLDASPRGLTEEEASRRLDEQGPAVLGRQDRWPRVRTLVRAIVNPLVLLLAMLSATSFVGGDAASGLLMLVLLSIGVGLRFVQETRADLAAAGLRAMIQVHATVLRDGEPVEVPIARLVPGEVVQLAAGDMVPADVRLLSCKDLFISQAVLTGESFPIEKFAAADTTGDRDPLALQGVCYLGTSVESGTAHAVVVAVGRDTLLGSVSETLEMPEVPTAFDIGMQRFTWMMIGFAAVMVPVVFLVNGLLKGSWSEAFFFSLAVAVGLTPEMLPMIVAVSLSRGAIGMSQKRVIVKHLDSIQNLGAMDVLCTDKTGTLTLDRIILERHCDVMLKESESVLALAWLNSHFQSGLRNLLDRAILEHERMRGQTPHEGYAKLDEIPFDFSRRVMSVVVSTPTGGRMLICKGAPESVYPRCVSFMLDGELHPIDHDAPRRLARECDRLAAEGFRVLAVASRDVEPQPGYTRRDERDLVLQGYVAFLDPPKDSAREALAAIAAAGVGVKVLTGDNELVSRKICLEVGIDTTHVLLGDDVERMNDGELSAALERVTLLARLNPGHKQRVVGLLRKAGHVVGFLGDGVNDALALRTSDVGISVESAVDIARENADCILLDKDLRVLLDGIHEGRQVFVNVVKYVRMGASSNFGNMLSVVGASFLLPFVPMTPLQILVNNLLYDCSQVPIPGDRVDPELVARPTPWSLRQIARYILLVGPCSSIFDFTTFAVMLFVFGCTDPEKAALFRTGWFVESLVTQTFIIHVIRTDRIPFLQSHASLALVATTAAMVLVGIWLPGSPLGPMFGFAPLPGAYWPILLATVAAYAAVVYGVKRWLVGSGWID
ncbi:MAG: magnesium-translocating P-type ATPase [Planctomycetia bacterium]|nr:magnesium-translocating P-type ATPase [Planctomycetia bacterium]